MKSRTLQILNPSQLKSIKERTTDLQSLENLLLIQTAVKVISSLLLIFINLLNKWILLQSQTPHPKDFPLKSRLIKPRIENTHQLLRKLISHSHLLKRLNRRTLMKKHTITTDPKVLDRWSVIIIIIQRYIYMTMRLGKCIELDVKCVESRLKLNRSMKSLGRSNFRKRRRSERRTKIYNDFIKKMLNERKKLHVRLILSDIRLEMLAFRFMI